MTSPLYAVLLAKEGSFSTLADQVSTSKEDIQGSKSANRGVKCGRVASSSGESNTSPCLLHRATVDLQMLTGEHKTEVEQSISLPR